MKFIENGVVALVGLSPTMAFAAEEVASEGFPWSMVVTLVLGVLASVAGLAWGKVRKAAKESKEAFAVIEEALADGNVDDAEVVSIMKECREAGLAWAEVVKEVIVLIKKSNSKAE